MRLRHSPTVRASLDLTAMPARCVGRGASPPITLPVGWPTSRRWGRERVTAPPSTPSIGLGANAPAWTACGPALAPDRCAARLPLRLRLTAYDCAPPACESRAAWPHMGRGLRPRHLLRRHGGATADLPDCPAQATATLRQPTRPARPSASHAYSPVPLRGCGFRRDLACPACRLASRPAQERSTQEVRRHRQHATPHAEAGIRLWALHLGTRSAFK